VLVPERQWTKRMLDLVLTVGGAIICLPIFVLIALWIKWDSPGPVFYSQRRIGYGGKDFRAWKFRSMISHADRVLERHLLRDSRLREEWERTHKLRDDPRLTRVGRFLRRTSLDELPQLWNVWKGEMSLVGPRPIVDAEVARYGNGFGLYTKVRGGLTGLWQVSGRTDTSYEERVQLDKYYVRNWSVWLDLCILFRTIGVVLLRKGAY
jgi:Undecaprenyl-phosphate galactose phosphotransferase WbaP